MIKNNGLIVYANFDTGHFMNTFTLAKETKDIESDANIQKAYNLKFKDFDNLSFLISVVVNQYLDQLKEKQ